MTTSTPDSDLDLNGYINLLNSDICTGVTLVGVRQQRLRRGRIWKMLKIFSHIM